VLAVNYEDVCGVSNEGSVDTDEFGASAFYQTQVLDNGFFAAEIGLSKGHQKYRNSLCTIDAALDPQAPSGLSPDNMTAGVISGRPEFVGFSAEIHSGYDWDLSGIAMGPRFSLNTWWKSIDAYSENEAAGSRRGVPITGASLRYEEQDISSVQTRIGFSVSKPFDFEALTVVPFLQLDYIHEFANDQRAIKARMAARIPSPSHLNRIRRTATSSRYAVASWQKCLVEGLHTLMDAPSWDMILSRITASKVD